MKKHTKKVTVVEWEEGDLCHICGKEVLNGCECGWGKKTVFSEGAK